MRELEVKIHRRSKKKGSGINQALIVKIPDNIVEAIRMFTEVYVYDCFVMGHIEYQKRVASAKSLKRKRVTLDIEKLSLDQREALSRAGLLPPIFSYESGVDHSVMGDAASVGSEESEVSEDAPGSKE